MLRPNLTPILGVLVASIGLGCTGRQIEGAWYGPVPMAGGEECRIQLRSGGVFDLQCRGGAEWEGIGRYRYGSESLKLEFETLSRRGEMVRRLPTPLEARISGPGNEIRLRWQGGGETRWVRRMEER